MNSLFIMLICMSLVLFGVLMVLARKLDKLTDRVTDLSDEINKIKRHTSPSSIGMDFDGCGDPFNNKELAEYLIKHLAVSDDDIVTKDYYTLNDKLCDMVANILSIEISGTRYLTENEQNKLTDSILDMVDTQYKTQSDFDMLQFITDNHIEMWMLYLVLKRRIMTTNKYDIREIKKALTDIISAGKTKEIEEMFARWYPAYKKDNPYGISIMDECVTCVGLKYRR